MDVLTRARAAAGSVVDPELPMLTLADLGVLRSVELDAERVVVTLTPTYMGCPALDTIRADVLVALRRVGVAGASVQITLAPPWSTDDISADGRRALAEAGIAPPGPRPAAGPVPLTLGRPDPVACPRCGAADTRELSHFGSTACKAIRTCRSCDETFEHVKAH